jgi:hypothetical protein
MHGTDYAVVVAVIVFLLIAYLYAAWQTWDDGRREARQKLRDERIAQVAEDAWMDSIEASR